MFKITLSAVAAVLALGFGATSAQAQSRVFVAAQGADSNPCSFAAPCRTFQHAHDVVAAGGEINVLDPAGYGSVTISKSISVQGHGFAGITATSGWAITINGAATDKINLNGLIIEGANTAVRGIQFWGALSLTVENCVVRTFTDAGIAINPSASSDVVVSSTLVASNGNAGIYIAPTGSATTTVALDRVQVVKNALPGILVRGDLTTGVLKASVSNSLVADNASNGIWASSSPGGGLTKVVVSGSVVANNGLVLVGARGILANGSSSAHLWLTGSVVTGNGKGWEALDGAQVLSAGDNTIEGNDASETAPPTYSPK